MWSGALSRSKSKPTLSLPLYFNLITSWCIILSTYSVSLFLISYHDYGFWITKKEAITLPTDVACLDLFVEEKPKCLPSLILIFDSGLKRWLQFSFWITNMYWNNLGLAWKRVRSVLEMTTLFSLCSYVRYLWTYLASSLLILKISIKIMQPQPELISMDLAICWTVRHLIFKTIR